MTDMLRSSRALNFRALVAYHAQKELWYESQAVEM